jgi:hypothetical protein
MPGNDGIVRSYGQARKALLVAERCNWTRPATDLDGVFHDARRDGVLRDRLAPPRRRDQTSPFARFCCCLTRVMALTGHDPGDPCGLFGIRVIRVLRSYPHLDRLYIGVRSSVAMASGWEQ